jgi:hypothetical protein
VNYNCDRRRTISETDREFTGNGRNIVDFSFIETDHDDLWATFQKRLGSADAYTSHRESAKLYRVAERGLHFPHWLSQRPESIVILCSHAAFLRCIWNYGQNSGIPRPMPQVLDERLEKSANPLFRFEISAVGDYTWYEEGF